MHPPLPATIHSAEFAAVRRGDERAFARVFDAYFPQVLTFCRRLLRLDHLAEEAAEDVFIQFWKARHRLDPEQGGQALLFKIARDVSYTYLQRMAREERYRTALLHELAASRARTQVEGVSAELLHAEERRAVRAIIDELPPRRRAIFKMHFFAGADNGTIASRLSLSPHTVKAQLVKARAYLRGRVAQSLGTSVAVMVSSIW